MKVCGSLRVFGYGGLGDTLLTVAAVGLNFVAGLGWPVFLLLYASMVNAANGVGGGRDLLWYLKMTLSLGGAAFVLCWFGATTMELAAERQTRAIRSAFIRGITRQEIGWFDGGVAGQVGTKLSESIKLIREALGLKSTQLCYNLGVFVGAYAVSFTKSWKMTLVVSAMLPLMICCNTFMVRYLAKAGAAGREAYADAGGVADEAFGAMRTVSSNQLESKLTEEFTAHCNESFRHSVRGAMTVAFGLGISLASDVVTEGVGFWYGTKLTADDLDKYGYDECLSAARDLDCFDGGKAITVVHTLVTAVYAVSQVGPCLAALAKASSALVDVEKLTHRQSKIDPLKEDGLRESPLSAQPGRLRGEIEFRDVTFAYPPKETAKGKETAKDKGETAKDKGETAKETETATDKEETATETAEGKTVFASKLNLRIPAGQTVALVGSSGCGKSTLVQLIERFYDPSSGAILIDGVDSRDYNLKWLRSQIALVSQEPRLFAASIKENIALGCMGVDSDAANDETKVVAAAKRANAHSFIQKMPKHYGTYCGEGGSQLSGGQKQRIAIARAIIRDPSILILDEATSALDNESQKVVQDTLDRVVAELQTTTIVIAHRLSCVRNADLIVVFDSDQDGAFVAEKGTHEELMARQDGLYRSMVLSQIDQAAEGTAAENKAAEAEEGKLAAEDKDAEGKLAGGAEEGKLGGGAEEGKVAGGAEEVGWGAVLRVLRPWWTTMGWGTLLAVVSGTSWPVFAIVMGKFIQVLYAEDADVVRSGGMRWGLAFFGYALLMGGSTLGQQFFFGKNGARLVQVLRLQLFKSIVHQDMDFFDRPENSTGRLNEVLSDDVLVVQGWVGENLGVYIRCATTILVAAIISFASNLKLGAVSLASFCILAPALVLQYKFGGYSRTDDLTEAEGGSGFVLSETVSNIRVVAAYSLEQHMIDRYQEIVDRDYFVGRKKAFITGIAYGFVVGGQWYGQGLGYWYGSTMVSNGEITAEVMWRSVLSFILASYCIAIAMAFSVDNAAARRAATRIWAIKNRQPRINVLSDEGAHLDQIKHELRFHNVTFRYPQRPTVPVYDHLSFHLQKGQVVALVGPSGCGKSTAVQLIERFYDVSDQLELDLQLDREADGRPGDGDGSSRPGDGGRAGDATTAPDSDSAAGGISIDGVDIRDLNLRSLRSIIGLVSQEPVLFNRSIAENVAIAKPGGASLDQVEAACKLANAHSFICALPDGYNTKVGNRGGNLSGGQKQRIAIARALIRNPSLLILDEATSALDTESERVVQNALDDLLENHRTTTLVIAHRLSTVRNADKIVVLVHNEDGTGSKVAEVGTHTQLMDIPNGVYRRLVEMAQLK